MSEISEEATRLIDNFEYDVEDAVSDYTMAGGASYKNQARYNLEDYIAELEALIGKLIEIGEWGLTGMVIAASFSGGEIHDLAERRQNEWLTLVKDWKEREE